MGRGINIGNTYETGNQRSFQDSGEKIKMGSFFSQLKTSECWNMLESIDGQICGGRIQWIHSKFVSSSFHVFTPWEVVKKQVKWIKDRRVALIGFDP